MKRFNPNSKKIINWKLFEEYNSLDARQRANGLKKLKINCSNPDLINILTKSHFVVPGKTKYSCQQCGECCRYARKVADLTYEPCIFLTEDNKCSKHDGNYLVCKWFPFFVYDDPHYGSLLTIKPYCSGYGKGELVNYKETINRIKKLEITADNKNDGAFVIHEVLYLPEKKEWVFPSRENIDKLLRFINESSGKQYSPAVEINSAELNHAQHFTNGLLGSVDEPQITVNEKGVITDLNSSFLSLIARKKEDLLNHKLSSFFVDATKIEQEISLCLSWGRLNAIPERIKFQSGETKNVIINAITYRSRIDGLIHGLLICFSEVSEAIFTEINHSKDYARGLIESSLDLLVFLDKDGIISDVNRMCCELLSKERNEIIGTRFIDYFDDENSAAKGIDNTYKYGFVKNYILNLNTSDGPVPVSFNASLYKNHNGIVKGIFAAARDIRETKALITDLEKTKNYARSLIESSIDLMVTINKEGKIMDVNESACKMTGFSKEKLIGSDFCDYFVDKGKAKTGVHLTFEKGKVEGFELLLTNSNGAKIDVSFNASIYKEIDGSVAGIFASARDIRETKALIRDLEKSKNYARSLIESSIDLMVTINKEGKIMDVNEAACKMTGRSKGKLIGSYFYEYFVDKEKATTGVNTTFAKGRVEDFELLLTRSDGSIIDVSFNASLYKETDSASVSIFAIARDITEQKLVLK